MFTARYGLTVLISLNSRPVCGAQSGTDSDFPALLYYPVSIIPPTLHTFLLAEAEMDEAWESSKKTKLFFLEIR